jgi:hypothetical protein
MNGAVVYWWERSVPGREAASMELMRDTNAFLDKAHADGHITDYAWYLGMGAGMHLLILRGELEQLSALMATPEALAINTRAALVNEGMRHGVFATGDTIAPMAGLFEQLAGQLA